MSVAALARDTEDGSIQHCSLAQGFGLTMSGGSVPTFRANTKATPTVFIRSRSRQLGFKVEDDDIDCREPVDRFCCRSSLFSAGAKSAGLKKVESRNDNNEAEEVSDS